MYKHPGVIVAMNERSFIAILYLEPSTHDTCFRCQIPIVSYSGEAYTHSPATDGSVIVNNAVLVECIIHDLH